MSAPENDADVIIVGSGITATSIAVRLVAKGFRVTMFEKGGEYAYPHSEQFAEKFQYFYSNPAYAPPADIRAMEFEGTYGAPLNEERIMRAGGQASAWTALTPRYGENDFRTRTKYKYGLDWPVSYADLEPFYAEAEDLMSISGTDADNPFAPPRSKPFPLPAFELGGDDRFCAEKLKAKGIIVHTTPQARTREARDGRPACANFGACTTCPIGARYSPNHHHIQLLASGRCTIVFNASVRRVLVEQGKAKSVVVRLHGETSDREFGAKTVLVAAGAIESVRLLLLSSNAAHRDGLGNNFGHLGRSFMLHHQWMGHIHMKERIFPGRAGFATAHSIQHSDPATRGKHGGLKVNFTSASLGTHQGFGVWGTEFKARWNSANDVLASMKEIPNCRRMGMHAECDPSPDKQVLLSTTAKDRFGDPIARVVYKPTAFDHESYVYTTKIFDEYAAALGATSSSLGKEDEFVSGHHHMGGARMSTSEKAGVLDAFGRVHGTKNVYVLGGAQFVTSGSVNPTLTMVALALRAAGDVIAKLG